MTQLTNSKRLLFTASYVATKLTEDEQRHIEAKPGGALRKLNLVRALDLNQEQLAELRNRATREPDRDVHRLLEVAERIAVRPGAHLEHASMLARVPDEAFLKLARAADQVAAGKFQGAPFADLYDHYRRISPIGRLYLERIEMFPIGMEQGELVFTVPMAPNETITISHKEWSTSAQEYEQIVQDFFESYSERGVAEKTDSSMATENEARHSNTINFGATLTGGYGPVSLTTTFGLTNTNDERESVKQSMQRNRTITEKASARTRQEHKVSVKLETRKGVEDSSFRTIANALPQPVRIDFFRMMRKWRTQLYRYGLRMTYDITVPTPGVRLWARWQRIAELDRLIGQSFMFTKPSGVDVLKPGDISEGPGALNWMQLATHFQAQVAPPPKPEITIVLSKTVSTGDGGQEIFEFTAPPGYKLAAVADAEISYWGDFNTEPQLNITDVDWTTTRTKHPGSGSGDGWYQVKLDAFGGDDKRTITLLCGKNTILAVVLKMTATRTPAAFAEWQYAAWAALRNAALVQHTEVVARWQGERDRLWRGLATKDTLSLRRLEREEMLRLIMLWLLGPIAGYSNAPAGIEQTLEQMLRSEELFFAGQPVPVSASPTFTGMSDSSWSQALAFGDLVKFVQQAVEWENLLYFLYPYFWGSEKQGRDRLLFEHPDPEHQNFLRAGYARVVITVRPGFEEDFTRLVETGSLAGTYTSPYLPIAEEIATFARTNYTGIPPANPEKHARPLLYPQQRHTWDTMQSVVAAIEDYFAANKKYPASLADLPAGTSTRDAWGNELVYTVPGSGNEYDLVSYGADGKAGGDDVSADISAAAGASLVAEWFDYTPTSGLDIHMDTKLDDIA